MVTKILWINPIGSDIFDVPIKDNLNSVKYEDTIIDVISFKKGPKHLEYQFYEALMGIEILKAVKIAEIRDYDAAIIGCFYDPFLSESREISNIVVTAPAESSVAMAISLGHKFSIIVGRKKWIPQMEENISKYGLRDRFASFRSINMGVLDFQLNREETEKRLMEAGMAAINEDGAEVLILGCTVEFGFYKKMQKKLGVPVIDATIAPLKYAEFLVNLKNMTNLSHSKIGKYEPPPEKEIKDWNLEEYFGIDWK
ncbi:MULTISPECIES: aspartate/glutamate racemase family protein [Acidiplasma]|uniref:Hydantoin racemase n=1 Tax=Acidiplasma aeolicum TaxID=507754 RepID=A0A0P9CVX9_9ARCH|nr:MULTISPECIES: aspartate/glutamate racemase family protein [Acidiplasma]KPV47122.1 hydantoin racemase [Acidiplasma aeolicum]KQB36645.1 hydantoin racemase [Acidiplasma aeolicum]